jgi:hypothetical protein
MGCVHIGLHQVLATALTGYRLVQLFHADQLLLESINNQLSAADCATPEDLQKSKEELESRIKETLVQISMQPRDELSTSETEIPAEFMEAAGILLNGGAVNEDLLERLFLVIYSS